jgi:hypothetical protein
MSTRYLIAALLMTSACVAQADVLPTNGSASTSIVNALYGKTSADQSGAVNVNLADGVEGPYVIGTSNTIMAAMLGFGMSSVFHRTAVVEAPVSFPVADSATISAPVAQAVTPTPAPATEAAVAAPVVAADPVVEAIADVGVGSGSSQDAVTPVAAPQADAGTPGTLADAGDVGAAADATEVPEPSSIALMMAGMAGALALGRRRRSR